VFTEGKTAQGTGSGPDGGTHARIACKGTNQGTPSGTAHRTRHRPLLGIGHSRTAAENQGYQENRS